MIMAGLDQQYSIYDLLVGKQVSEQDVEWQQHSLAFQYPIGSELESDALNDSNTLDYLEVEGIALCGHSTSPWLAALIGKMLLGSALGVVVHSSTILNSGIAKCSGSLPSYCINVKENCETNGHAVSSIY